MVETQPQLHALVIFEANYSGSLGLEINQAQAGRNRSLKTVDAAGCVNGVKRTSTKASRLAI